MREDGSGFRVRGVFEVPNRASARKPNSQPIIKSQYADLLRVPT